MLDSMGRRRGPMHDLLAAARLAQQRCTENHKA
jgi:hypothetical protein